MGTSKVFRVLSFELATFVFIVHYVYLRNSQAISSSTKRREIVLTPTGHIETCCPSFVTEKRDILSRHDPSVLSNKAIFDLKVK